MNGAAAYSDQDLHIRLQLGQNFSGGNFVCVQSFGGQNDLLLRSGTAKIFGFIGMGIIDGAALAADASLGHVGFKGGQSVFLNDAQPGGHVVFTAAGAFAAINFRINAHMIASWCLSACSALTFSKGFVKICSNYQRKAGSFLWNLYNTKSY